MKHYKFVSTSPCTPSPTDIHLWGPYTTIRKMKQYILKRHGYRYHMVQSYYPNNKSYGMLNKNPFCIFFKRKINYYHYNTDFPPLSYPNSTDQYIQQSGSDLHISKTFFTESTKHQFNYQIQKFSIHCIIFLKKEIWFNTNF